MAKLWFPFPRLASYACLLPLFYSGLVQAAPEEIQVYMDEFADKGKFGLDLHTIYVASTRDNLNQTPLHQLRLTPELSYGLNDHFETAAYFLTNKAAGGDLQTDGVKVRMRWRPIIPTESTVWYAAVNIELGRLAQRFSSEGSNGEIKGILTWKAGSWAAGVNLNIDRPLRQHAALPTTTEIDSKVSYHLRDHLEFGVENYDFLGPLRSNVPGINPNHSTFLVTDFQVSKWDIHLGIGQARGAISDKLILKAIIGVPI